MVELRDYQQACLDSLVAYRRLHDEGHPYGGQRALVAMATGLGKTQIFAQIPKLASKRVLVIAHREELLDQAALRIQEANPEMTVGIEQADRHAPEGCKVLVGSIQTFAMSPKRLAALRPEDFSVVVVDECFPAGTLIDGLPIEQIQKGDFVRSLNHQTGCIELRQVTRTFQRAASSLIRVTLENGVTVDCTPDHPFYTPDGYLPAKLLTWYNMVAYITLPSAKEDCYASSPPFQLRADALFNVRSFNQRPREASPGTAYAHGQGLLLRDMQFGLSGPAIIGDNGRDQPQICFRAHGSQESNEQPRNQGQGSGHPASYGMEAAGAGGEWEAAACCSDAPGRSAGMEHGGSYSNKDAQELRLPDLLQDRHWQSNSQTSYRSGWGQPRFSASASPGSQKSRFLRIARVESIAVQESRGAQRFGQMPSNCPVYNLEVEGNNNYFANGILVHNCHHATAATYLRLLAHFGLAPDQAAILQASRNLSMDTDSVHPWDDSVEGVAGGAKSTARSLRAEYRNAFKGFKPAPGAPYLVGFTATPSRSDGMGLEWILDDIVYSMSIREGMEKGWLCKLRGIHVESGADISTVPTSHGDYQETALARAVDTRGRNALAVQGYLDHASGRKALVFCVNVEHAEHMLDAFQQRGIPSAMVVGETPREERRQRIAAFRGADIQVLVGVMVFTEGFDAPETSCIIMARPTKSSLVYTQAIGRGTRIAPGKADMLVLDMVDINKKAQVQTLNTLFGLPIKLRFGDVLAAVKAVEEVQSALPLEMFNQAESIEDIQRMAREFDPLAATMVESYIAEQSSLSWVKTPFGYALGVMGKGQLGIVQDLLGNATLRLKVPHEEPQTLGRYAGILEAVSGADDWVRQEAPELMAMLDRTARWRTGDATPKQIAFLNKLKDSAGKPVQYPPSITKGQASALIDRYKRERHVPEWVRR